MLRIAVVAHGRFHAFDLARELGALGHQVSLLSNYPAWAVDRFGIRRGDYTGFWMHGGVERVCARVAPSLLSGTESLRHRWFGRWAARALEGRTWDVVHCWSGISGELLSSPHVRAGCRALMRGSAHIAEQAALLTEEEYRVRVAIERPSRWMIEREEREYALADRVVVLSEFARASFERRGVPAGKIAVVPLGVSVDQFRVPEDAVQARITRILEGGTLRVLFVGTLSARKGLHDVMTVARMCADLPATFTLVGPVVPETRALLAGAGPNVIVLDRRDQDRLPEVYAQSDLFLFPTIEDGFGMVLTQAAAAGLVILASPNCAAPEILASGAQGWVLPVRQPRAMAERVRWCHEQRADLAALLTAAASANRARTWRDVAADFAQLAEGWSSAASEGAL